MVTPPMPDEVFRREMVDLLCSVKQKIGHTVKTHLQRKLTEVDNLLTNCNPLDIEEAEQIAKRQLHNS